MCRYGAASEAHLVTFCARVRCAEVELGSAVRLRLGKRVQTAVLKLRNWMTHPQLARQHPRAGGPEQAAGWRRPRDSNPEVSLCSGLGRACRPASRPRRVRRKNRSRSFTTDTNFDADRQFRRS
jgi:hypothetical protein